MAATAWAFYTPTKHKLGLGTYDLSSDIFNMTLWRSAVTAPAETATLSLVSQISLECSGGAYVSAGTTLSSTTWTLSGVNQVFDSSNWVVTATGTPISAIKYAVIANSVDATGGQLLCWSQLSTTGSISLSTGNTLTIQMNAAGIFTLA